LNNVTNHLTRIDSYPTRTTTEAHSTRQSDNKNFKKNLPTSFTDTCNDAPSEDRQSSSRLSTQQQARKFLSQKTFNDNLLRISDEPPPEVHSLEYKKSFSPPNVQHDLVTTHQQRPSSIMSSRLQNFRPIDSDVDYVDNVDSINNYPNNSTASYTRGYPIGVDLPHDDREPLLITSSQQQYQRSNQLSQPPYYGKVKNHNDLSISDVTYNGANMNGDSFTNRQHRQYAIKLYGANLSNQSYMGHQESQNNSTKSRTQPSKYENSSHRKYESREPDRVFSHSNKTHWSCESCTYRNTTLCEICEMCGKRKVSR